MKQSGLIEVFAGARKNCIVDYDIAHKTSRHARPDATELLLHLSNHIASSRSNVFQAGRDAGYEVESLMEKGMDMIHHIHSGELSLEDLHSAEEVLDNSNNDEMREEDLMDSFFE